LYTCGGAALIFLGYEDRRTGDVDIIHNEIDKTLAKAWLNPTESEIEIAKKYTLKQSDAETYEMFVDGYIRMLKNELGI